MRNAYKPTDNFNIRLEVFTNFKGKMRDHRECFSKREYRSNQQDQSQETETFGGFPPIQSATEATKPKDGTKQVSRRKNTKADEACEEAYKKDRRAGNH